jgi:hypothetical protein
VKQGGGTDGRLSFGGTAVVGPTEVGLSGYTSAAHGTHQAPVGVAFCF